MILSLLPGLTGYAVVSLILLGAVAGFLSGLLGIGGGMLVTPFLVFIFEYLEIPSMLQTKIAITTVLMMMVVSTFASAKGHYRSGHVDMTVVRAMLPGMLVGSIVAGWVFNLVNGVVLTFLFAFFVMYSAYRMWHKKSAKAMVADHEAFELPRPTILFFVSAGICFVSGLVGAGGAFLMVPFFAFCAMDMHRSIGTSAALTFPVALFNTVTNFVMYWSFSGDTGSSYPGVVGHIFVSAFVCLVVPAFLMAPLGVRMNKKAPVAHLKKYFSILLVLVSILMLIKGIRLL